MISSAPLVDSSNKSLWGIPQPPIEIDLNNAVHPMEIKTPLCPQPCDTNILQVSVTAAQFFEGSTLATLPSEYGCVDNKDIGREKASPEIRWTNITEDVVDFSLEVMSMGDATCPGKGEGAGQVLWLVTGIKPAPVVTIQKGASHDSRLLRGGKEGQNQWLEEYYSGPCPMAGVPSCYRFRVLGRRANGQCQCGFQDVLFNRVDNKVEGEGWTYASSELAPVGAKKD